MSLFAPRRELATHDVVNQAAPLEDVNLFTEDAWLRRLVAQAGADAHADHLAAFGARAGSVEAIEWGMQANRHPPALKAFDRFGHRIDEVDFHPAYHALMRLGIEGGVSSRAWTHAANGHVAHAALLFLMTQAEAGVCCPMSMTYAAVPALRASPGIAAGWLPGIFADAYDERVIPADRKNGITVGMAMTEKQGGSDVRANTTRARPVGEGAYELTGHKWFCSAPMCDAFLTLAYSDAGLTCFLVPRWRSDGRRNPMEIQRLKDKMGDRANASAEIEYRGALAWRLGEEGRGVRTIVEMVNHTRLDCAISAAALMRQSLSLAIHHAQGRTAFQRRLIDQPLMQEVLASIAVEVEASMALAFRAAALFDAAAAGDRDAARLARVVTPVAKYWATKRAPAVVAEAMEALGGGGYIEEGPMPRLFRASPLNAIWEGSGNIIALDILRALFREPDTVGLLRGELADLGLLGADARAALAELAASFETVADERRARALAEQLAIAIAAASLQCAGREAIAASFLQARRSGTTHFGAAGVELDVRAVLREAALAG
jgi:putative acyl-CoA dehydrogenase